MTGRNKIILASIGAGVAAWVIDGALDYFVFFENTTLIGSLITDVSAHEIYVRLTMFAIIAALSLLISRLSIRVERSRDDLQKREKWLATTLSSIGDAVIATDIDGRVTFMNPAAEKLTGYRSEESLGSYITDVFRIVNEFTGQAVTCPLEKVLDEGVIVGLANHTVLIAKDGNQIAIDDSGAPIEDDKGNLLGAVLVFSDITERRRLQKEAELAWKRAESILESINDGFFAIDSDFRVTYFNSAAEDLLGVKREDVLGKKMFEECFVEAKGSVFEQNYAKALKNGESLTFEAFFEAEPYKNWYQVSVYPFDNGISIYFQVITERKESERALRASEQQLNSIFAATPIGLAVLYEREIRWVSNSILEMTGYDRDYLVGRSSEFLYESREEFERVGKHLYDRVSEGNVGSIDTRIRVNGGGLIDVHMEAAAMDPSDLSKGITVSVLDITDRKNAERALKESEEKYKLLVENLHEGIWAVDSEGTTTFVNSRMADMLGYARSEMVGNHMMGFIHADEHDEVSRLMERRRQGIREQHESRLIRKDGGVLHSLMSATPIEDDEGGMIGALAGVTDITDRIEHEERIDHLNRVLRAIRNVNQLITHTKSEQELIERACDMLIESRGYFSAWIILKEEDGKVTHFAESGIGSKFGSFVKSISDQSHPYCWHAAIENRGDVSILKTNAVCKDCTLFDTDKSNGIFCKILRHDDHVYGLINLSVPASLMDDEEEKELFVEVANDISFALYSLSLEKERLSAERNLAEEKERLAVTLESIGDGVIATDNQGRVVLLNKVAEELTGWNEAEAFGRSLDEVLNIINEETGERAENPVERVLRSGQVVGLANHTALISRDGTRKLIADSGAPIRDSNNQIIGVVLVFRDVTETRRLQEFAVRAQRLETAGRIAGQVAHDFNNLLGPLMAYPMFIREQLPPNHAAVEFLDEIEQAATRIADINQQLLTLGRRGHYTMEPLNLNGLIEQVIDQMKPLPDTLVIEREFEKPLMNVRGGSSQLMRVFSNLIRNAADAMMDVGAIKIRTQNYYVDSPTGIYGRIPRGEYVKISIEDTGCGIPSEALPKIFDPFFTTKTVNKSRGSGLGLSVVHAVMEDHGAHIDCVTEQGEGTTFYLYFPVSREEPTLPEMETITGGSGNILVVDDDASQRDVTQRLLEKLGYEATVVRSGEAAVAAIKESDYELMILDMIMPEGIDGTETYRRVLQIKPNQKAIIVSGYAETERVQEALALGAGAYVRKPLTLKSISMAVRQELDRPVKSEN